MLTIAGGIILAVVLMCAFGLAALLILHIFEPKPKYKPFNSKLWDSIEPAAQTRRRFGID